MKNINDDGKQFYVIRFIEVPFEGVDNYVCVPHSWLVIRRLTDNKVAVAYPDNEDPFDTRDRAKRKEKYSEEWKYYMAEIKYETESYREAEYWIASRNDFSPLVEKDPRKQAAQSEPTSDRKLPRSSRSQSSKSTRDELQLTQKTMENLQQLPAKMSLKQAAQSEAGEQREEKQRRHNNAAQSSHSAGSYINIKPGCSNRERSTVIGERDRTETAVASSSDKPASSQLTSEKHHQSSSVPQAGKQQPSLPIIDVEEPTEVINIDEEDHLQRKRQPSEVFSNSQSQCASNLTTASMAPPQTPTSVQQPSSSDHHDSRRHSQDSENSDTNFQPIITDVRSVGDSDTNQTPRNVWPLSKETYASHHLPRSLKMSAKLYSHMNERPPMIPMHEPVETKIRLANCERLMAIAAQNPSNLMDQTRSSPPRRHEPAIPQSSSLNIPHFRIKIGKSSDTSTIDPQVVLERIDDVASGVQHTPRSPHQRPSFVRRINKRQRSPHLEQQQPMDVPEKLQRPSGSHSVTQRRSIEELSMHEASFVQRPPNSAANQPNVGAPQSYQSNPGNFHQEQRQDLRRSSTEGVNPPEPTRSGIEINIPACYLVSTKAPNQTAASSNSSQQKQPPQYHQNTQLQPRLSEPQIGIPTNTSNDRKLPPVYSATQRSPPYVLPSILDSVKQSFTNSFSGYLQHLQRLEAGLQGKPIDHNPSSQVPFQNIPVAAAEVRSLERPQQYGRELPRSDSDNVRQPSLPQQRMNYQPPDKAMKRVQSKSNITHLSAVRSPPRSANHVRHTNKRMEVDPVSSGRSSSSDSEVVVDHEVIPEQDTVTSNPDCARTSGKQDYTSADNQPNPKLVIMQQMLEYFSTIMTQTGSNLYYSCEMYKNLRGSILETADTYKKLMDLAEKFNALGGVESTASSSSTVAPKILPLNKESNSRAPKRANSSNRYPNTSEADKESPNKKRKLRWRVVLPAEYDPNDTGWTLKCKKMVPALKELLPGRGIYVNCAKLMHAERVSGDCKTLASLVIEEVFSEIALTVCSTWHETKSPNKCWVERPPLDPEAWDTLFNYVLRYGCYHDWKINTEEIIKAMDKKIYEIRVKNDVLVEPYSP